MLKLNERVSQAQVNAGAGAMVMLQHQAFIQSLFFQEHSTIYMCLKCIFFQKHIDIYIYKSKICAEPFLARHGSNSRSSIDSYPYSEEAPSTGQ